VKFIPEQSATCNTSLRSLRQVGIQQIFDPYSEKTVEDVVIAKLLLSFLKAGSLNPIAMSEF